MLGRVGIHLCGARDCVGVERGSASGRARVCVRPGERQRQAGRAAASGGASDCVRPGERLRQAGRAAASGRASGSVRPGERQRRAGREAGSGSESECGATEPATASGALLRPGAGPELAGARARGAPSSRGRQQDEDPVRRPQLQRPLELTPAHDTGRASDPTPPTPPRIPSRPSPRLDPGAVPPLARGTSALGRRSSHRLESSGFTFFLLFGVASPVSCILTSGLADLLPVEASRAAPSRPRDIAWRRPSALGGTPAPASS